MKKRENMKKILLATLCIGLTISILAINVSASPWIDLKNNKGELTVNNSPSLNNVSKQIWNIFVKQNQYIPDAGIFGKYQNIIGKRSYVIRTSNTDEISMRLSGNGDDSISYSSNLSRNCGIRKNGEWTMLSVRFNGSYNNKYGLINYYHNGKWCDADLTTIKKLYNVPLKLEIGGGNNIFLDASIDDGSMYKDLPDHQLYRLFQESEHGLNGIQTIPVLIYHQVTDPANAREIVSVKNFKAQMAYLKSNGFTTITTNEYAQWQKGNFVMPKKPLIIYTDDGRSSVYKNVVPIFDQYGYKGNIAVVTKYADKATYQGWPGYMNWSQLKTLQNKGWEISSHSVDHIDMLTLSETAFRAQLSNSKTKIKANLGKTPISFIFPFHSSNMTYTSICGKYYELCWTVGTRDTQPLYIDHSSKGKVYQSLKRIQIYNTTNMQTFKEIFAREMTKPTALWPINEGVGKITYDKSGNRNNALLNANAVWHI